MKNKSILFGCSKKYRVGLSFKKKKKKEGKALDCKSFEHCATEVEFSNILSWHVK